MTRGERTTGFLVEKIDLCHFSQSITSLAISVRASMAREEKKHRSGMAPDSRQQSHTSSLSRVSRDECHQSRNQIRSNRVTVLYLLSESKECSWTSVLRRKRGDAQLCMTIEKCSAVPAKKCSARVPRYQSPMRLTRAINPVLASPISFLCCHSRVFFF
jgi:hypothetical protein